MAQIEAASHLESTAELSLDIVKKRAISGVLTLTGRTFLLQAVNLTAFSLLTVFLDPVQYGLFFLISAVVNFFNYFSDVGLAAALIQKKDKITKEDLRTTFTVQQVLVGVLLVTVFLLTPLFRRWYSLENDAVFLLWALAFSLFFSSLKTIPSVLLERRLDFNKLVLPQIVETILFNVVAVYLAWKGFGITSFTLAVLVRGISGLVLIYLLQPWVPGFGFAKESLRGLLRFGLPYQLNTFLALVKDDGIIMLLGGILGPSGVGLLGWAQKWAFAPLRFFMDQVIKVTFPAFSRIQNDKQALTQAVSHAIFFVCFLVFPSLVGLLSLAPLLTEVVPRYEKWQPALIALGLFAVNAAFAAVTTPLTNMFSAIGKITITFRLMIMWTILTWLSVPILAIKMGINGAALGSALVGTSSIVAIWIAYRLVRFDFLSSVGKPFLASIIMGLAVLFVRSLLPISSYSVAVLILLGISIYGMVSFILVGPTLVADSRKVWYAVLKK